MGVENATSNASTSIRPQIADATNNQRCRGAVFCLFWHKMHLLRLYCPTSLKIPVLLCWFILKWILFVMVICWARHRMLDSFGRYNSCCLMFSKSALEIGCAWFLLCLCNNCICKFCVSLHLQRLYLVFLCVFVFATVLFEISLCRCICNNCIWNLCVSLYLQQLYLVMTRVLCRLWPLIVALPPVQLMAHRRKR